MKNQLIAVAVFLISQSSSVLADEHSSNESFLSVKEVMTAIIEPMTNRIWQAQDIQTDAQWKELENAALSIIGAANLIAKGGTGTKDDSWATNPDWQQHNNEMVEAARAVISATHKKDAEALSEAGNMDLYPPCENCHTKYLQR